MEYTQALTIAQHCVELLAPHCIRIEIAGSLRRKKAEVKDIEIVAIPKPYGTGLFQSGIATVVDEWECVKGHLPCKYTQRILPEGIKLDLFFADIDNWGYIFAIRTGSADYSHHVLAKGWNMKGFYGDEGQLRNKRTGQVRHIREEIDLFHLIGMEFIKPENRFWDEK
jgi:DNA polymerase/3'-5' exonuclease PolX